MDEKYFYLTLIIIVDMLVGFIIGGGYGITVAAFTLASMLCFFQAMT